MSINRYIVSLLSLFAALTAYADGTIHAPEFHGAIRTRFEMTTQDPVRYRFQVRNARLTMAGNINSSINYFVQTDLCDQGKMKILDAWGKITITKGLAIQAGQFRMPFGIETFRAPANYIFANRTYMGKQMCNYRAVGAKFIYALPSAPLTIEAGAFNPRAIGDHNVWQDRVAAAGKATLALGSWTFEAGLASLVPDSVRANLLDGAIVFRKGRWEAQAEYMYEHYTGGAHSDSHSWVTWVNYGFPIHAGVFNKMSVQARYDGLYDHASLTAPRITPTGSQRIISTDNPTRNRITLGATMTSQVSKGLFCDVRANWEHAFFHHSHTPTQAEASRILLEMVLRF
ncbi:MAG: OprO/OprP family phosphate-selective porin [Pseudoflavonifractor sp.]|nr:OprO/OprP family phosphate-selective porin [Alloprevotella sp.]MCM1116682.1 OprO/OprP family phosphate-selective porin [Pseudoflavonifractor sp.]